MNVHLPSLAEPTETSDKLVELLKTIRCPDDDGFRAATHCILTPNPHIEDLLTNAGCFTVEEF